MANYKDDMWPIYLKCIRIIVDDHMPKKEFEFRSIDFNAGEQNQTYNFDEITDEDVPEKILKILYNSLKNIRKNTSHVDPNSARLHQLAITVRRTSYLAELETLYCYALRTRAMACG